MNSLRKQLFNLKCLTLSAISFFAVSCEEVIEVDLNGSNTKLVVEGLIEKDSLSRVKLSYTSNYFTTEKRTYVENATVVISDRWGNSEVLKNRGDGLYAGSLLRGVQGNEYTMSIQADGLNLKAVSTLFPPVYIMSANFEKQPNNRPGQWEDSYALTVNFSDNPTTENYYLLKFWVNDILNTDYYTCIKDSYYTEGDLIEYSPFRLSFKQHDKVVIYVYSIDQGVYNYFNQLNDINGSGMGGSSTPYNAKSNFGSEVLGYFRAWSSDSIRVIVR